MFQILIEITITKTTTQSQITYSFILRYNENESKFEIFVLSHTGLTHQMYAFYGRIYSRVHQLAFSCDYHLLIRVSFKFGIFN